MPDLCQHAKYSILYDNIVVALNLNVLSWQYLSKHFIKILHKTTI